MNTDLFLELTFLEAANSQHDSRTEAGEWNVDHPFEPEARTYRGEKPTS